MSIFFKKHSPAEKIDTPLDRGHNLRPIKSTYMKKKEKYQTITQKELEREIVEKILRYLKKIK